MPCANPYTQTAVPGFFSRLHTHWPFARHWPDCHFIATTLIPGQVVTARDFTNLNLPAPQQIRKRQIEFLAGRYCASLALSAFIDKPPSLQPHPEYGYPLWPTGFCGSISHSHGWVGALVGRQKAWLGLGLDIERYIAPPRAQRLRLALLTGDEFKFNMQDTGLDEAEFLTCVFSAKESLFKALHPLTHCYFGFHDAQIVAISADGVFHIRLLKNLSKRWPAQSLISGQWCRFAHGIATLVGLPAKNNLSG